MNFLQGLLDRIRHLLQVNLAHDVKSVIGHRISFLSETMESDLEGTRRRPPGAGLTCRNFAFSGFSQFEKIVKIPARLLAHFFRCHRSKYAELERSFYHERRLVALAAMRHRRQIWRVRLNQHALQRNLERGLANLLGLREGQVTGE